MEFRKILVAIDESPIAARALETARDLATRLGAELGIVHVVDNRLSLAGDGISASELLADLQSQGRRLMEAQAAKCDEKGKCWRFLKEGSPGSEIVTAAKEWDASLLVVGTHGRRGVTRVLLGSTAENVLRHAPCPVLIVKNPTA